MTRAEVAQLAGVPLDQVAPATAAQVRAALADSASYAVVEVATHPTGETGQAVHFWRVGSRYYLDDPTFDDEPVAIDDLDYNSDIGLHVRKRR